MADQNELEKLYREAQSALKAKEYDRAAGLLTQILVIDDNYKDVSRLLAKSVKLKRRRWYSHPALWGTIGILLLIGLGFFIAPKISSFYTAQPAAQIIIATTTPSPIPSATATATLLPTPTPIPLTWKRISMGQDFQRDTITAFATDKKDTDVIYAAMKNAGVYKTIDSGLSWRPAHHGLASTQVETLLIDSQDPRILYAGTTGGIFKTEDGGGNWYRIGDGTYLLMDLKDNSHLYVRDENSIFETTDQGNNWTTAYTLKKDCPDEIHSWAIHPTDGNMLFIGGGETCAGVYQSTNGGRTWKLTGMEDKPNIDSLGIGLDEQGNLAIYAQFLSPILYNERTGIFVSHDGGETWSRTYDVCPFFVADSDNPSEIYCGISVAPPTPSIYLSASHIDHPNGQDRLIASVINPANADYDISIFISTDNGISWAERDGGLGSARAELKIDPTDSARMYIGVYYPRGYNLGYIPMQKELTYCTLYRSVDSGKNWLSITRVGNWCGPAFDAADAGYIIESNSLQKLWDGGERWLWKTWRSISSEREQDVEKAKRLANRLPMATQRGLEFQSLSANPYVDGFIYAVGDTIYYSTNAGVSWQLSAGSEGSWDARLFYTDQSKKIYALGRYHQSYSTDNGKTWQACGEDVTTSRSDTRMALDLGGSRLYLATPGQGVLVSTDNCGSWQASNDGLSNLFVNTLAIDPKDSNTIYAGTDGGAYISFDSGQTWGQVNDGLLGATVVYSIVVDKDSNVYAATPYGIFKLNGR